MVGFMHRPASTSKLEPPGAGHPRILPSGVLAYRRSKAVPDDHRKASRHFGGR